MIRPKTVYEHYLDNGFDHVATVEGHYMLRDRDEGKVLYYDPKLNIISPYGGQVETFRDN